MAFIFVRLALYEFVVSEVRVIRVFIGIERCFDAIAPRSKRWCLFLGHDVNNRTLVLRLQPFDEIRNLHDGYLDATSILATVVCLDAECDAGSLADDELNLVRLDRLAVNPRIAGDGALAARQVRKKGFRIDVGLGTMGLGGRGLHGVKFLRGGSFACPTNYLRLETRK